MIFFIHISPADIFKVGLVPFVFSAMSVMTKYLLQAVRFKYFIKKFIGHNVSSTGETICASLGGQFVTQTTPSYVGGELVRIAWLNKKGVLAGKAAWITTMEIISDVFVGTFLAFIAGAVSILHGGYFIGVIVILIAIPTFTFWFLLIFFSARRVLRLPTFSLRLLQRFVPREKAQRSINSVNTAIADLCQMSRQNFNSKAAGKTFAVGIAITLVAFIFQGISFMVLIDTVGPYLGLFDSVMATSASTALSNLPITIGGSGLAELGMWAYISNLNSLPSFHDITMNSHLNVIIAWRIASYHVPLLFTWIALMRLAIGKVTVTSTNVSQFSNKAIIPDSLSLGDKRPNMYNAQEINHDKDNSLDKPPLERNGWKDEKDKKGIVDR
jgi:glycosyltransferase 2 family protein